ncbi:MAG: hypothetical protein KC620_24575 [Myxococcales bacterium]|nr:hypothetical protein [Myxococcales bacterium]
MKFSDIRHLVGLYPYIRRSSNRSEPIRDRLVEIITEALLAYLMAPPAANPLDNPGDPSVTAKRRPTRGDRTDDGGGDA